MYSVSNEYKALATAAVRKHDIDISFFRLTNGSYEQYAAYREQEDSPIISLKIINGQTTGGFSIGGTYCSTLEITAHINVPFQVNDKVEVQTHFRTMDEASGSDWLFQGVFYIDTITANQYNVKIIALDAMARLAKDYNSTLSYPAAVGSMLSEISSQSGAGLSGIDVFNNASIATKPIKATDGNGNEIYYTRREVLGYLAGINGGNAYINNVGKIAFSTPRETNYAIKWENVISQTFGGAEMSIDNVVLNKSGTSSSTADNWDENAVQLYAPLDVADDVVTPIKQKLSGTHYESITLKKQGTGMFEPGDLVTYTAPGGTDHKMLIMGVVYELTGGFFSETLYSLAKSSAQTQYSGTQNISQNIAPSNGTAFRAAAYEYLSDISVKYNGVTYTVEKDESGLICKISDNMGNSLKPAISGEITDIPLHNAVFWAVAMHGGLAKNQLTFDYTGIVGMFIPETLSLSEGLWKDSLGGAAITLSGGSAIESGVHFQQGEYGSYTVSEPNTVYVIVRARSAVTGWVPLITKQLNSQQINYGFDLFNFGGVFTFSGIGDDRATVSSISVADYHVICYTRNGTNVSFYINGVLIGTRQTVYTGRYVGNMLLNSCIRGESSGNTAPDTSDFIMCAFGTEFHAPEVVANNMKYLAKTYGI